MSEEDKKPAEKGADFSVMLKEFFAKVPKMGDLAKGTLISVDSGAVRVDIGGIATGVIRGRELFSESREFSDLKVGDTVEATVIEQENEQGEIELSFRSAGNQRLWDKMATLMKDSVTAAAKAIAANKGGLMMQVDALTGFLPVSQLNPDHYPRVPGGDKQRILEELRHLIGKELQVKIIDVNQVADKLIVSEKAVWEDEQKAVLDAYKIGDIIEGEISAVTSFGAFVRFGEGLEGLIHISEIVWQRIDHPKDVLKIGDRVRVQIIDLNKSKIYLSMKRLTEDPWKAVKEKYKVGQAVEGEVHKVEPFGLMVKLDADIHGLAHISELSDEPMIDLKDKFLMGQKYQFEIVSIEPAEHRLGLKLHGVKGRAARPRKSAKTAKEDEKKEESAEAEATLKEAEKAEQAK